MNIAVYLLFGNDGVEQERRLKNAEFRRLKLERKTLRDKSNPFTLHPEYFRQLYRMPAALALDLVDLLRDHITVQGGSHIPVELQILAALRFFAEGSYQKGASQDYKHPLGRTTFGRCLHRVVIALSLIDNEWIKFPDTREERQLISNSFREHNRIPNILGLIDCFVVKFVRPSVNEEAFYHHRHSHSMNVQVVTDCNYVITSIRICPGSNNDRYIWRFSNIKQKLLSLRHNQEIVREEGYYYLLGDSGYTPSPVLLTPIIDAQEGSPAAQYTREHVRTRCKVEQTFGLLSNSWLAISRRRILPYKPKKVALIILACAVLHNFKRLNNILDDIPLPNYENIGQIIYEDYDYQDGLNERRRIVHRYY